MSHESNINKVLCEWTISELMIIVTVLSVLLINVVWIKSINYTTLIHLYMYIS